MHDVSKQIGEESARLTTTQDPALEGAKDDGSLAKTKTSDFSNIYTEEETE